MEFVTIENTVYVRDEFGVRSQLFVKGQVVEKSVYDAATQGNEEVKKSSASAPEAAKPLEPVTEPEEETADKPAEVVEEAPDAHADKPAKVNKKVKEGK